MKYLIAIALSFFAITAQAGVTVTPQMCGLAESFVINAYSGLRMGNPNAYDNIATSAKGGDLTRQVGAIMANNFIFTHNAWAPQYEQWANQNARRWCSQYIGQSI